MDEQKQPAVEVPAKPTVRPLVERLEAAAHAWEHNLAVRGDYMPSPTMLREAKAEIERMTNWLEGDCICPCCTEVQVCDPECTFSDDCPHDAERMAGAREALFSKRLESRE